MRWRTCFALVALTHIVRLVLWFLVDDIIEGRNVLHRYRRRVSF